MANYCLCFLVVQLYRINLQSCVEVACTLNLQQQKMTFSDACAHNIYFLFTINSVTVLCTSTSASSFACTSSCLLSALVNGTSPAFSVAVAAVTAAPANPPVLPPALPARDTNPWAKNPAGAPASAQPGKQLLRETHAVLLSLLHPCNVTRYTETVLHV